MMEKTFNVRSEWGEKDPFRLVARWRGVFPRCDLPDEDGWISSVTANSLSCGYEVLGWNNIRKAFLSSYDAATGRSHGLDRARQLVRPQRPECDFIKDARGVPATYVASIEALAFELAQQKRRH